MAWDANAIHRFCGADALPPLVALSPVLVRTGIATVVPQAIRVRTAPGAQVAAWADQLGSFANGTRGIVVQADEQGVAIIDAMTGRDGGAYPFYIASPARSGLLVISLHAE